MRNPVSGRTSIHYGWVIAAIGTLCTFAGLGLGRFALGMLLPSIMAAAVGDYAGPERMAMSFGLVTFIFGLGQIAGPSVAGMLAEMQGSFAWSFLMAAAFAALAVILSLFLKKPGQLQRMH